MTFDTWISLLIVAIGMSCTPGPTGLLYLNHAIQHGAKRALITLLGSCLGFVLVIYASLIGIGALLAASESLFHMLRWLGVGYLLYLGICAWKAPAKPSDDSLLVTDTSRAKLLVTGFLISASNPKSFVFFTAFIPQFMNPSADFGPQASLLASTLVGVEFIFGLLLCRSAAHLSPWIVNHMAWFNRLTGALFITLAGALSIARRA